MVEIKRPSDSPLDARQRLHAVSFGGKVSSERSQPQIDCEWEDLPLKF